MLEGGRRGHAPGRPRGFGGHRKGAAERGEASTGRRPRIEITYAGSAAEEGEYPGWAIPEIAVTGRSNAGKSSLLNCLGERRDLARTSRTPGRTQRLHFFSCRARERRFALVDLPGYGFARASKSRREEWGRSVERYLLGRENLRALVILVDVRRDPEEDERLLEDLASDRSLGVIRVATKIDKLGRSERVARMQTLAERRGGPWIAFSARTGEGREQVLDAVVSVTGA